MEEKREESMQNALQRCNICKQKADVFYRLPYRDLQGSGQDEYVQRLCLCRKCGFMFTQNPFTEKQLEERYKKFSKFEFDAEDYILDESEEYRKRSIWQKQFIDNAIADDFKSILEVGAASGYNLSLYKEKEAYGIEPSKKNCLLAKENYDVDLFNGMFSEFMEKGKDRKKYDLIFLSNALEHIVNPYDFILECKLLSNKYIFVEVPTADYKYIEEPFGMFCEEHVNYFTLEGLNSLMTTAGFELVDVNFRFCMGTYLPAAFPVMSTIWKINENIKKTFRPILSAEEIFKSYIMENEKELELIKDKIEAIPDKERLAVWGTGHHASMLLANTSLGKKNIVKVYDGDKRKSRYTFAGVSIESFQKSDILNKEVDAILIATYTAQTVISKLVEPYKEYCKIYYLYDL